MSVEEVAMKKEVHDIAIEVAKAAPGIVASAFTLNTIVAFFTLIFVILQILYLGRKWWREETAWGLRLKRWAAGVVTQRGDLE